MLFTIHICHCDIQSHQEDNHKGIQRVELNLAYLSEFIHPQKNNKVVHTYVLAILVSSATTLPLFLFLSSSIAFTQAFSQQKAESF